MRSIFSDLILTLPCCYLLFICEIIDCHLFVCKIINSCIDTGCRYWLSYLSYDPDPPTSYRRSWNIRGHAIGPLRFQQVLSSWCFALDLNFKTWEKLWLVCSPNVLPRNFWLIVCADAYVPFASSHWSSLCLSLPTKSSSSEIEVECETDPCGLVSSMQHSVWTPWWCFCVEGHELWWWTKLWQSRLTVYWFWGGFWTCLWWPFFPCI